MDAFRHPGLFRLFFICLLLLGINNYARGQAHAQVDPPRKTAAVLFFIMLACGVVLALKHGLPNLQSVSAKLLPATLKALSFSDRYLIHLPFSLCVLWFAYLALQKRKKWYWLCILAAADMFVFVQLCLPVTVTGARSMIAVEQHLGRNLERFPLPGHTSIAENSLNSIDELLITGSKIPFLKKPGRNAYFITPGNLQLQDSFYASPIRESVFAHSMLYVADSFANYSNSHKRSEVEEKTVYLNRAVIHADKSRRPIVNIYALSANEIKATIDSSSAGKIILLQNFYPGWKAFADGKAKTIEPVNITYMGVNISAGTKELKFVYKPLKIIYSFYMAAIVWLLFVAMIIADLFSLRRAGKHQTEISRTGST